MLGTVDVDGAIKREDALHVRLESRETHEIVIAHFNKTQIDDATAVSSESI